MTGNEIRKSFIDFFKSKEHKYFESASLIPDDKTLLLTVAGMVPFKSFFLGEKEAPFKRITTYQKCIRTNDLENVGVTTRHQTFFEMLGNFSFGDYFKREAIFWSWEYITEILKLESEKLWVSVFLDDDEAYDIWNKEVGVPKERIVRLGEDDNWWAAGPIGSCGPCSEIYIDLGEKMGCGNLDCKPGCDCDRYLEIWNLVFTEWNRLEDGSLVPLPEKNIDTGAGLERIAAVMQKKESNFDTDLFIPIINETEKILEVERNSKTDKALKIIADHVRAAAFLIGDGVLPSNEGRGYILRKLIRRAFGVASTIKERIFEKEDIFLYRLVPVVAEIMREAYPEMESKIDYIEKVMKIEEEKFTVTLKNGVEILKEEVEKLKKDGKDKFPSEISFKLYDTYGFPFELTKEVLEYEEIEVSEDEFLEKLEEQKIRSKSSKETISDMIKDEFIDEFYEKHGKTKFIGYEEKEAEAKVLHVNKSHGSSNYEIIFDQTPFYAESGGQVADTGIINSLNLFEGKVVNVIKKKDIYIHEVELIKGIIPKIGDELTLKIDKFKRKDTQRNHTATHILHKALREVLGSHVEQSGSLVDSERLRFDFSHYEAVSSEQIEAIERIANQIVLENIELAVYNEDIETAKARGAMALFGDKYGDEVRVVEIPQFSIELCGGTHVKSTGEIGLINIESESGIASGVRRITATTGYKSLDFVNTLEESQKELAKSLKVEEKKIKEAVEKLKESYKDLEKDYNDLQMKFLKYEINDLMGHVIEINGTKVLIKGFENKDNEELKEIVDRVKDKLKSGVVLIGANNGNAMFLAGVSKDLTGKIKAGDIVKEVSKIANGNGGGRPDFAQAGGKAGEKVYEALEHGKRYLEEKL